LINEHLQANGGWEFQTLEDSEEVEENLSYLVSLYAKSENKYNRDEIREIANNMTAA
jgi:glutathionyl-hydroquinone reductase